MTGFVNNPAPFTLVAPDWFRDNVLNNQNHLDTDVVLALDSSGAYPDYRTDSIQFAGNNDLFLQNFRAALNKMSRLGVGNALSPPTECQGPCHPPVDRGITAGGTLGLIAKLGNATAHAALATAETNLRRKEEIKQRIEDGFVDMSEEIILK